MEQYKDQVPKRPNVDMKGARGTAVVLGLDHKTTHNKEEPYVNVALDKYEAGHPLRVVSVKLEVVKLLLAK